MSEATLFSTELKERTTGAHSSSEHADFMGDLMKEGGTLEEYTALVAQHWFMYEAIEEVADQLANNPDAAPFIDEALRRLPAIEADLVALLGENWREQISALPATERYAARIRETASWPAGFVAHHYTRYLGDLSGGQFIGKVMRRRFDLGDTGASFYVFENITNVHEYKDQYRAALDAVQWDADERERFLQEVLLAYQFNTEVFEDLAAERDRA